MSQIKNQNWTKVISSDKSKWNLNLFEVIKYKDLLFLFVKRDFIAFYKQTILGPLWFFIQPLFTSFTYYLVLVRMGGLKTDGFPPFLFFISGMTIWNYFRDCFQFNSMLFIQNTSVFGKVYFPRLVSAYSIIISQLLKFAIQSCLLIIVIIYFHYYSDYNFVLRWELIFLPIVIFFVGILGLSGGILISALTTKYRDLLHLVSFGIQLLMYFSGVIVSIQQVNHLSTGLSNFIFYNPISQYIEFFKIIVLGHGELNYFAFANACFFTICLFFISIIIFNKVERNFMDNI